MEKIRKPGNPIFIEKGGLAIKFREETRVFHVKPFGHHAGNVLHFCYDKDQSTVGKRRITFQLELFWVKVWRR